MAANEIVNQASTEIRSAIKYKLINNLYRKNLGINLPYDKVINKYGGIKKANEEIDKLPHIVNRFRLIQE